MESAQKVKIVDGNNEAVNLEDLRKIIDIESKDLLRGEYKVGQECELSFVLKVIGEQADLGEPHIITFKIMSIVTPRSKDPAYREMRRY